MQAPDAIEPALGWRAWDVVELDGRLRLCSLAFWTIWLPGRRAEAACRRGLVAPGRAGPPSHTAPYPSCSCGIYATQTAAQALAYARQFSPRPDVLHRVLGTVSLWGEVVESEGGWRAAYAYPATLLVPAPTRRPRFRRRSLPRLPAEEVARGLSEYGCPVEVVAYSRDRELTELLDRPEPAEPGW